MIDCNFMQFKDLKSATTITYWTAYLQYHSTSVARWVAGLPYSWCCQMQSDVSIGKFVIFWQTLLRMLWRTTVVCVVYSDFKKLIWQKRHELVSIFVRFCLVHHTLFAESLRSNTKNEQVKTNHCSRALTHRLEPAPFWPAKMSNWWIIRRSAVT